MKDGTDLRLMPGDELRLKHKNASNRGPWECLGNVIRFDQSEEVCLELRDSKVRHSNLIQTLLKPHCCDRQAAPDDCTVGYTVDFIWKATSFDRMKDALHTFREYSASISGYLFHSILGHPVEPMVLKTIVPKKGFNVTGLPELNHSQVKANLSHSQSNLEHTTIVIASLRMIGQSLSLILIDSFSSSHGHRSMRSRVSCSSPSASSRDPLVRGKPSLLLPSSTIWPAQAMGKSSLLLHPTWRLISSQRRSRRRVSRSFVYVQSQGRTSHRLASI